MIYISFESAQRAQQVEHIQFENLEIVQFRKIKFYFTNMWAIFVVQNRKLAFIDFGKKLALFNRYVPIGGSTLD